jgi:hypothetical protein
MDENFLVVIWGGISDRLGVGLVGRVTGKSYIGDGRVAGIEEW